MPHFFHSTELRIFSFTCHAHEKEARSFQQFYEEEKWFIYWKFASWKFLLHWRGTESGLTWVILFIPFFCYKIKWVMWMFLKDFDELTDEIFIEFIWKCQGFTFMNFLHKQTRLYKQIKKLLILLTRKLLSKNLSSWHKQQHIENALNHHHFQHSNLSRQLKRERKWEVSECKALSCYFNIYLIPCWCLRREERWTNGSTYKH